MSNKTILSSLTAYRAVLVLIILLSFSQLLQAQVYRCEKESGNIVYSDEPCAGGDSATRLNWLKTKPASKKQNNRSADAGQAKKTARKAKKNDEAYVLLSLMTTSQLELETASLRSIQGEEKTELPELILPDGITVDLLMVDKMEITYRLGKKTMQVRFVMSDGYEEVKTIYKPFPVITGRAKIGRFSKSLADIKRIEFFNSEKLRKARGDKNIQISKKKVVKKNTPKPEIKEESPVIELDLSEELPVQKQKKTVRSPIANYDLKTPVNVQQSSDVKPLPVSKLSPNKKSSTMGQKLPVSSDSVNSVSVNPGSAKSGAVKDPSNTSTKIKPAVSSKWVPVVFADDKTTSLLRVSLGSSKGNVKAQTQYFMLNEKEQIPFHKIKSIRVRPTADKSKLVVAVQLKSGEIKMENMQPPFTRVQANTEKGAFNHSLLDIKSISFQR